MANRERPGEPPPGEEGDLFRRIRSGDVVALDLFLERQWSPLVSYVETFLGPDDAEDIAQEAILRIWAKRNEWTPTGSLRALAYSISRNLALNELRRRRIHERRWSTTPPDPPAPQPSPSDNVAETQLRSAIDAALETLPARRREIVILSRFHELSHNEIAGILGISPQTVANQITAALATLRVILRPFLSAPDAEPGGGPVNRIA